MPVGYAPAAPTSCKNQAQKGLATSTETNSIWQEVSISNSKRNLERLFELNAIKGDGTELMDDILSTGKNFVLEKVKSWVLSLF